MFLHGEDERRRLHEIDREDSPDRRPHRRQSQMLEEFVGQFAQDLARVALALRRQLLEVELMKPDRVPEEALLEEEALEFVPVRPFRKLLEESEDRLQPLDVTGVELVVVRQELLRESRKFFVRKLDRLPSHAEMIPCRILRLKA